MIFKRYNIYYNIFNFKFNMTEQAPELQGNQEDITALMEQILQRLKILNYQREFLQSKGMKPLNIAYFTIQTNPSQQFNYFKTLVKWLLQLNDVQGADFSKYDDPMTVATNILTQCKKIGIACDYPPLKLKSGSGEQVLTILHQLTSKALKKKNFVFKKPKFQAANSIEQNEKGEQETNMELQDQVEDVQIGEEDQDDKQGIAKNQINEQRDFIVPNIPEKDWIMQCERVANKLKVPSKPDTKQWRAHVQSTRTCGETIKKSLPESRNKLQKLNDQLTKTLEKIHKSQKVINSSMSEIGAQYRNKSEDLKKLGTHYNNLNTSIKEMNESYRVISQKLQSILAKTNQHSGTMTDNSPVVKIKASIQKLTTQIKTIDVRIGVLNHTVLQHRAKEKRTDERGDIHGFGMQVIDQFDDN